MGVVKGIRIVHGNAGYALNGVGAFVLSTLLIMVFKSVLYPVLESVKGLTRYAGLSCPRPNNMLKYISFILFHVSAVINRSVDDTCVNTLFTNIPVAVSI
jgi:hypothetical protein